MTRPGSVPFFGFKGINKGTPTLKKGKKRTLDEVS